MAEFVHRVRAVAFTVILRTTKKRYRLNITGSRKQGTLPLPVSVVKLDCPRESTLTGLVPLRVTLQECAQSQIQTQTVRMQRMHIPQPLAIAVTNLRFGIPSVSADLRTNEAHEATNLLAVVDFRE